MSRSMASRRDATSDDLSAVVVTGSRVQAPEREAPTSADLSQALREAAARGDRAEVTRLLDAGAPIDAADPAGVTALMKSVQANHPATAVLLVRRGASTDRTNRAGVSARDMAATLDDPRMKRALGIDD